MGESVSIRSVLWVYEFENVHGYECEQNDESNQKNQTCSRNVAVTVVCG